jgi:hypothetical protein
MKQAMICAMLLVSPGAFAASFDDIKGTYVGGGRAGVDECRIEITNVGQGYATFKVSIGDESLTSPPVRISAIDRAFRESPDPTAWTHQQRAPGPLTQRREWYVAGGLFPEKTHAQNSGLLNFARVQYSVTKLPCFGFGCTVEYVDLNCPVQLESDWAPLGAEREAADKRCPVAVIERAPVEFVDTGEIAIEPERDLFREWLREGPSERRKHE